MRRYIYNSEPAMLPPPRESLGNELNQTAGHEHNAHEQR